MNAVDALEIRGLDVAYTARPVLSGVSLHVPAGSLVSLIGPSGCGKTTLLRTVAGLVRPAAGEIRLFGRPVNGCASEVGFLFQEDALLPWRTAAENVALGPRFRGAARPQAIRDAGRWLERVGLADFAGHYPHELSGGMRKRVALAQVLAARPRLLLMDEPFASLDAIIRNLLEADFLTLARDVALSVVLVTHDLEEALVLSDRVALMSGGPAARITRSYEVPFAYPRDLMGLRSEPAFGGLLREVWEDLRCEVSRTGWRTSA